MSDIFIEVDDDDSGGRDLAGRRRLEDFADRAGEIASSISDVARALQAHLDRLDAPAEGRRSWATDRVEVTFGVDVKAETSVVLAKTTGGCNFSVKVTWARDASGRP